jgi:ABC-type transport system involved in cytochrome c biogenesis permease subunit
MSWLLVPLILFIEWKNRSMIMSVVLLPFVILALFAILIINSPMAFLSPKLKSYWMYIHVPTSLLAILFLFISFGASLMYLVQNNAIKLKKPGFLYDKLPSLAQCDLINYNSIWIGFILISIGMISGMLWSKKCFGEFWQWDIKEILTLLVWIVYLIILIYRLYMKWTAKIIAYLSIIGFLLILITFLGYAYISKSYHSF